MTGYEEIEINDSIDKVLGYGRPSRESLIIEDVQSYLSSIQPQTYQSLFSQLTDDAEVHRVEQLVSQQLHPKMFDVKFENVSFRYSEDSDYIFKNLSCEFIGGKIHGLVSPSGYGKTTFLNLAVGLLQPTSGRVLVNGMDINDPAYDMPEFLSHTAYITQHTQLFMDSLLVNILMGNHKLLLQLVAIADEHKLDKSLVAKYLAFKCLAALKHAQALDFVASQEKGLNTEIGDRVAACDAGFGPVWRPAAENRAGENHLQKPELSSDGRSHFRAGQSLGTRSGQLPERLPPEQDSFRHHAQPKGIRKTHPRATQPERPGENPSSLLSLRPIDIKLNVINKPRFSKFESAKEE